MVYYGDGGPPRAEPMMSVSEPFPMGERLRPPKRSVMNSRHPKTMVSLREKPSHDEHSPPAVMVSTDDGTIRMSRGHAANPPS
jgi:hypothetical protein